MGHGKSLDMLNSFYSMVARHILYVVPFGNTLVSLECFRGLRNFSFSLEIKNLFWLKLVNCNSGQTSLDYLMIYSTFLPAK